MTWRIIFLGFHLAYWLTVFYLFAEAERETPDYVKNRLNKRLFDRINAIEARREEEQMEAVRNSKMTKEEKRQQRLKKRQQGNYVLCTFPIFYSCVAC